MERRKTAAEDIHYYSDRLKQKLNHCLPREVIVEAPSGYGKTTAVRDYLEEPSTERGGFIGSTVDEAPEQVSGGCAMK